MGWGGACPHSFILYVFEHGVGVGFMEALFHECRRGLDRGRRRRDQLVERDREDSLPPKSSDQDLRRLFGFLEAYPVHSGRAQHGHRSAWDGLLSMDFAFASCHQYLGWLSEYLASEQNGERCYEKRDIMTSLEIFGVTIPILSAAHAAQWIYIRFTRSRGGSPHRAAGGLFFARQEA